MENVRPPSSRPMSIRVSSNNEGSATSSGRIGTASRLMSATTTTTNVNRMGTAAKNFGFSQRGLGERPLTQQGLSGFTTSQGRVGTAASGGMRQVKDKRYWIAVLQGKTQEIFQETEKLNKERKNLDRETSAKKLYEKKVKEQVKELSGLQSALADMNLALDSSSTGITRQQIQNETIAFREQNELLQNQLEQIFKERQKIEQQNQQLDTAIANEKSKMNEMIYSLSAEQQNRYREFQLVSESLKAENGEIHERIESLIKHKEKLSSTVMSSQARLEAVKLQSKLREAMAKRTQLKEEETNRLSPAQEREKLISDVKMNNQAIASMNKQMKSLSEQLNEKREQLIQIEQDLDEGSSEKILKYRELRKRDEIMSQFMDTFPFELSKEKQNVENLKNQITFMIEHITLQGMMSSKFNTMKVTAAASVVFNEKNDLNTQDGLMKEYGKLQIQLKQLKLLEKRMKKQVEDLRNDESNSLNDIEKFNNLNALRNEYASKYEDLSTLLQDLKDKKRVTENVVEDSERRNQSIKESLRNNENYRQISHMEERLKDLMKDNKLMQEIVDELNQEFDFSHSKNIAMNKVNNYNKILCDDLKNQQSSK